MLGIWVRLRVPYQQRRPICVAQAGDTKKYQHAPYDVFDFCLRSPHKSPFHWMREWQRPVHVCRRWRYNIIFAQIFASPRRLDLYFLNTRHMERFRLSQSGIIGVAGWPFLSSLTRLLPTGILGLRHWIDRGQSIISLDDDDNDIAALEHPDCVRCVEIAATSSLLGKVATVMQGPFGTSTPWHSKPRSMLDPAPVTSFPIPQFYIACFLFIEVPFVAFITLSPTD